MNVHFLKQVLLLVSLLTFLPFTRAAYSEEYALGNNITVRAKLNNATNLQWEITCDFAGWCGFGIGGSTMTSVDIFTIEDLQGSPAIHDRWSDGNEMPPEDMNSHYTLTSEGSGVFTVSRDLNTTDGADTILSDGDNKMIYAWGSSTSLSQHGTGDNGAFTMNVDTTNLLVTFSGAMSNVMLGTASLFMLLLLLSF